MPRLRVLRVSRIWLAVAIGLAFALAPTGRPLLAQEPTEALEAPDAADSLATPPPPPERWQAPNSLRASDQPNDNGHGIELNWALSPDDANLLVYEIWTAQAADTPQDSWIMVGTAPRGSTSYAHQDEEVMLEGESNPTYVEPGRPLYFMVRGRAVDGSVSAWSSSVSGIARGNWYHKGKTNVLIATLAMTFTTVGFIRAARRGRKLFIRPIAGINAVDEAIGRATEMGRPILFVLGTGTAADIATIAAFTILARVAKRTADYQTPILVPVNDPVMMAVGQETVKEAYLQAGRPDLYRPENVFYISAMQFPYVAAVNGLMLRERTATNFYMGVFHAESLLLAEAGSVTKSIQISGTDQLAQIPFFVAATDYTLIGEELYAASAYLSQEPVLLGPLKAQDWAKIVILVILLLGVVTWTFFGSDWFARLIHAV